MNKTILNIIDSKLSMSKEVTNVEYQAYRLMLYAGVQLTIYNQTAVNISAETGYSTSYIKNLLKKWVKLRDQGDVTVNLIICVFQKLSKLKSKKSESIKVAGEACSLSDVERSSKQKKLLGFFVITPEEERQERAIKRESILFMEAFGKGRPPRLHGEYYTPGTNPAAHQKKEKKWLTLVAAALYCGCDEKTIIDAAQGGEIERRIYKHSSNRNYYEYSVKDLDKFIKDNNLL